MNDIICFVYGDGIRHCAIGEYPMCEGETNFCATTGFYKAYGCDVGNKKICRDCMYTIRSERE